MNKPAISVRLKEESQPYHSAAERDLDLFNRTSTVGEYARLLARFYGFFSPMERVIGGVKEIGTVISDIESRKRAPLLRIDLTALGWTSSAIDEIAICDDLPGVNSILSTLGCLYVLEGSTLGGQFISRHLKERLNVNLNSGGRFFHSYGDQVGPMWKAFGTAINAYSAAYSVMNSGSNRGDDTIVQSACETFQAFGRWIRERDAACIQQHCK